MIRLIIVALFAGLTGSAMAVDEGSAPGNEGPSVIEVLPTVSPPAAAEPAAAPASAVPAVPAGAAQPPSAPETRPAQAGVAPKSSIPIEKRKGGDVTKCLELGSDREIAACAEKHR